MKNIEKIGALNKAVSLVGKKYNFQIIDCIHEHHGRAGFNLILKEITSSNPRII